MNKKLKAFILIIFFVAIAFSSYKFGFFAGKESILRLPPSYLINTEKPIEIGGGADFSVFWEAWRKLEMDFLKKEKIDYQEMIYGAIKGMVTSLGDPYTTFFTPKETEELEEELSGKYEGVGMEVGIRDKKVIVISPLEGTPAQEAGLKPGDKILKVNDTFTENLSLEEVVKMIRGPKDTEVTLLIQRESWTGPKEVILKRTVIKIPTLKWEIKEIDDEEILLIKIYQFNKILPQEFRNASFEILGSQARKIILDLRNNPGGYLEVAQYIAGWFLEKGDVVVWQDFGEGKERKAYKAQGSSEFSKYPLVVLINEGSASGAEILAGALRDVRNVKLIGEKSFGKGSVQEQIFLKDDSSLKVTLSQWLTPNGDSIDGKGLVPDIEVEITEEDWEENRDPQLKKALEIIKDL